MNIKIILLGLCVGLVGCSKLDDYMLGKDNTPQPKELKEIKNSSKISQKWSVPAGKSSRSSAFLKLKPVVKGNTIYTADASGLMQAVSKKDGHVLWSHQLEHGIVSGPKVGDGVIAVGTSASTLAVVNESNGKEIWQNKVSGELLSPPAIAHHKVVAKTIDGKVYAFDIASGKQIWMVEHGSPSLVLKGSSAPVILNNLVVIGYSDGKLEALDIDNGRSIWQRSIAYAQGSSDVERLVDIVSDPIVKDNIAYLASYQGYIGALSLNDGQFKWRKPGSVYKNMILKAGVLYLVDSNDVLWSIDANNGNVLWKQTAFKARGLSEPVLIGNRVAVGDKTGLMHIVNAQTGEIIGRSQLSGAVSIAPSVAGHNVFVFTDNGMLNKLSVS